MVKPGNIKSRLRYCFLVFPRFFLLPLSYHASKSLYNTSSHRFSSPLCFLFIDWRISPCYKGLEILVLEKEHENINVINFLQFLMPFALECCWRNVKGTVFAFVTVRGDIQILNRILKAKKIYISFRYSVEMFNFWRFTLRDVEKAWAAWIYLVR